MRKHTCLAALAILAIANTASPIDLGLAVGTRPILNRYYTNGPAQAFGFHVIAEIPFSNTFRLGLRGGPMGASMNSIAITREAPTDSFQASGFDAQVAFILLAPEIQDNLKLSCGIGVGYNNCKSHLTVEGEWGYAFRSSYDALVVPLTVGARLSLSEVLTVVVETEVVPAAVSFVEASYLGYGSSSSVRYATTQFGGGAGPTLNLALHFSL